MHRQGQGAQAYEFGVKVSLAVTHKSGLAQSANA